LIALAPAGRTVEQTSRLATAYPHSSREFSLPKESPKKYALAACTSLAIDPSQSPMRRDERKRMYELCAMIEQEQDHDQFLRLIMELNELLESKEKRLDDKKASY
jgi:hypothetical protein